MFIWRMETNLLSTGCRYCTVWRNIQKKEMLI